MSDNRWGPNPPPEGQGDNPWPVYGQGQPGATPPGPSDSNAPWPVYGGQPTNPQPNPGPVPQPPAGGYGSPYQQPHYGQQATPPHPASTPYGGYQGGRYVPPTELPSRTGPVLSIVGGILLMVVVAPIVLVGLILSSVGIGSIVESSMEATNGGIVTVDSSGTVGVVTSSTLPQSCLITDAGGNDTELAPELEGAVLVARGMEPGQYTLSCTGLSSTDTIVVLDGETLAGMMPATMQALAWSSVVGLIGLGVLIAGIVWLVKRNRQRQAIRSGYPL
ncbi:hypothetical protein [Actinomyces minihominis]|uniref:hypothetical protein n=1 Tax=Actinomyces minihominis TaxID=2002838 RepID=UPI000C06C631|nr:hypothetical protein [Actinomyces minihominis]